MNQRLYPLSLLVLGVSVGLVSFGHLSPRLLTFTAAVPFFWFIAPDRFSSFTFIFGYYLAASRGIPHGAATFFGPAASLFLGSVFWVAAAIIISLVWTALWPGKTGQLSYFRIAGTLSALLTFITVPPIGVIGWASPLLAVGFIFPGLGWYGIIFYIAVLSLIIWYSIPKYDMKSCKCLFISTFFIIFLSFGLLPVTPPAAKDFSSINTHYGSLASGSASESDVLKRSKSSLAAVQKSTSQFVLLPETTAGRWSKEIETFWTSSCAGKKQTVIVGAEIYDNDGCYDNCLIFLSGSRSASYKQRISVPISMWWPFGGKNSCKPHWFSDGIVELADGREAACLICYEQYLAWPILRSMASFRARPRVLIASANQWWSRDTCIPFIQAQSVSSWAALFNLELVSSVNN